MDQEQPLCEELEQLLEQQSAPLCRWAGEQLAAVDLGDLRRNERLAQLLGAMAQRPGRSLPEQCEEPAAVKAAYRLLNCPGLESGEVITSAAQATLERLQNQAAAAVLLAVQDTTSLNFTSHHALAGRGPICNHGKTQGFHAHSTLVLGEQGLVHGILDCEIYARDAAKRQTCAAGARNREPMAQKETQRWLRSLQHSAQLCSLLPQAAAIVNVADREADMYELFLQARALNRQHAGRHHVLVRARHDRQLHDSNHRLWEHLLQQPAQLCWTIELPPAKGLHGVQERRVEALWQSLSLAVPAHQKKYRGHDEPLQLTVLIVREPAPPKGSKPLEWVLLTTWPITNAAEARRVVQWYARRWLIEVMHRIWKSGCNVEHRRFQQARAAQVMIVLDLLTAVMLLSLTTLARHDAQATTEGWLSPHQCAVLRQRFGRSAIPDESSLLASQAVRWIAQLAGYRGAPSSPPPGAETLWRGLIRLDDMATGWLLASANKCG